MKKQCKTYAMPGMMEYQTRVFVGRTPIKIEFSGGSISNGCAQPARFETSSIIVQIAIENSDEFKRGRIRLERSVSLDEDIIVHRPKLQVDAPDSPSSLASATQPSNPIPAVDSSHKSVDSSHKSVDSSPKAVDSSHKAVDSSLRIVEVSCKDAAKAYLEDHFAERPAPLRTRDDVQACAAKYGIRFDFI